MSPGPIAINVSRLLPVQRFGSVTREAPTERRDRSTERLRPTKRTHARIPDFSTMTGMWEFQAEVVRALLENPSFLLSLETRMGKSKCSLEALDGAGFVVCPKSACLVWRDQCRLWRPDLTPRLVESGADPEEFVPAENELVITNYEAMPEPVSKYALLRAPLFGVRPIVDEAHYVKNRKADRTIAVRALLRQCRSGWLLTATPLDGTPLDLFGVLESGMLSRKAFGSFGAFVDLFGGKWSKRRGFTFKPSESWTDEEDAAIHEALSRVMLVKKKRDVMTGYPVKQYVDIPVAIPMLASVEDAEAEWTLFGSTKLPPFKMISKAMHDLAIAKIPAMLDGVEEHERLGHAQLMFSRHREPIQALARRQGWGIIHGDIPEAERYALVKKFQTGKINGLALTIQTGSMAFDLSRADYAGFVSCDYRAILNGQAEDRPMSLDRDRPLVVERYIADHPLDRWLFEILTNKETLERAVIR